MRYIVWAVDPLAEEKSFQRNCLKVVQAFTRGMADVQVEPVYILSPPNPYLPEKGLADFFENTKRVVAGEWKKLVGRANIPGLKEPSLLVQQDFSTKAAVTKLVEHARGRKADLIVASTHARKGMARALLGSFAETLVCQAQVPTLVVNPKTQPVARIKTILYPTDLSEHCKRAYQSVLALAKDLKAKVVLYHKVDFVNEFSAPAMYQFPLYDQYVQEDLERRTREAEAFRAEGEKAGVRVDVVLDRGKKYPGEAILAAVKKHKPDLVSMASQTGPWASALLGSVTRQVVRGATVPVWVIHSVTVPVGEKVATWVGETAYLSGIR